MDKIGNQYYKNLLRVNLHLELAREGELVFSTNTDADTAGDNFDFQVVLTFAVLIFIVFSIGKVYMMKMSDSY